MRHAKALAHSALGDRGRELAPRGWQEAQQAGRELAGHGIQSVLCSASARTRQTVEALGLRVPGDGPVPVEYLDDLYLGTADAIRRRIGEVDDDITGLLVVGHSPGIPTVAADLAWASKPQDADTIQRWFPTASYSQFRIDGPWAGLRDSDEGVRLTAIGRPGQTTIQT
ncbi:hypothetical protein GCM10009785_24860 [Brooklawnia cerclae]